MRILLLGGTRFVGQALAARLLAEGHAVTVCSRRVEGAPRGATVWAGERAELLAAAGPRQSAFEVVVDFTGYEGGAVTRALATFPEAGYLFISTTWLGRPERPGGLPPATRDYLRGKQEAEREVARVRAGGRRASVVRLPILCGAGDHTGRMDFYRRRLRDGGPVILVDGGLNPVPLLWKEDAVEALYTALAGGRVWGVERCDALPQKSASILTLLAQLAAAEGVAFRPCVVPGNRLQATFPAYLEAEPWWREAQPEPSPANLFNLLGLPFPESEKRIQALVAAGPPRAETDDLRAREARWWQDHKADASS